MEAKKCDRCGKFYTENKAYEIERNDPCVGGVVAGIATCDKNGYCNKYFDFCDNCLTDFFEFLKGKEMSEEDVTLLNEPHGTD